jgi:hypothetical protein
MKKNESTYPLHSIFYNAHKEEVRLFQASGNKSQCYFPRYTCYYYDVPFLRVLKNEMVLQKSWFKPPLMRYINYNKEAINVNEKIKICFPSIP